MLLKKTIGIIIILLNIGGIGFLLYRAGRMVKEKYFKKEPPPPIVEKTPSVKEQETKIPSDNIVEDEDDLLKDMDLSDLDNLDLDDFK